ncbi:unnamed protein product, partial [Musa textilis]
VGGEGNIRLNFNITVTGVKGVFFFYFRRLSDNSTTWEQRHRGRNGQARRRLLISTSVEGLI